MFGAFGRNDLTEANDKISMSLFLKRKRIIKALWLYSKYLNMFKKSQTQRAKVLMLHFFHVTVEVCEVDDPRHVSVGELYAASCGELCHHGFQQSLKSPRVATRGLGLNDVILCRRGKKLH